jgi:hypothetical protein
MNTHLTEEQISNWIAGDVDVQVDSHVRECAECRAKLAAFKTAMSAFRDSANGFANQEYSGRVLDPGRLLLRSRQARKRSFRWLAVAAAGVIVAAVPVYQRSIQSTQEPMVGEESQVDAQLLERVNAHLSQTAPASFQPLSEMFVTVSSSKTEGER